MLKTRHRESVLYNACLESKTNCVIDNTNPKKYDRSRYILPAKLKKFSVIGYFFESTVEDALKRNEKRKTPIPEKGIFATINKIEKPSMDEGFDILYCVTIDTQNNFVVKKM
jgi:predicted kinase